MISYLNWKAERASKQLKIHSEFSGAVSLILLLYYLSDAKIVIEVISG